MSSLIKQTAEKTAFIAYFLGAVVPLAALALIAGGIAPRLLDRVTISWTTFVLAARGAEIDWDTVHSTFDSPVPVS